MKRIVIKIIYMKSQRMFLKILMMMVFFGCKAQTIYSLETEPENRTADSYYVKDTNNIHDQIVGVWRWESGNSSFEITLQEFEQNPLYSGSIIYWDDIFGKYKFIEDGSIMAEVTTIANSIQDQPKIYVGYKSANTFHIQITDVISEKYKVGEFILNSNGTATMTLQDPIGSSGVRTPNDPPTNNLGFQLPTNITLTKIN